MLKGHMRLKSSYFSCALIKKKTATIIQTNKKKAKVVQMDYSGVREEFQFTVM